VTPDFKQAAVRLLADLAPAGSSAQLAEGAAQACEALAKHLSRLLGEAGVRMMLKRSTALATAQFPWLAAVTAQESASGLRDAMVQQDPASITEAFVAILAGFVGLLERLIGEPLVTRLLDEVWPGVFTKTEKDTP
jgi:hypothetical protein